LPPPHVKVRKVSYLPLSPSARHPSRPRPAQQPNTDHAWLSRPPARALGNKADEKSCASQRPSANHRLPVATPPRPVALATPPRPSFAVRRCARKPGLAAGSRRQRLLGNLLFIRLFAPMLVQRPNMVPNIRPQIVLFVCGLAPGQGVATTALAELPWKAVAPPQTSPRLVLRP
jgi:hypothetical protein